MLKGLIPLSIRQDFPALCGRKEKTFVYLDNAATTQKPFSVIQAIKNFYEEGATNVHRGLYDQAESTTLAYENCRKSVQKWIGARSSKEIIFTSGATASINLVASLWTRDHLKEGDQILLGPLEHESNFSPWLLAVEKVGGKLCYLPYDLISEGFAREEFSRIWSNRIRMVSISLRSHLTGVTCDPRPLIQFAHQQGVPVLVDATQSVGCQTVDVRDLGCDFLVFSAHKMCGPDGIGVLYGREDLLHGVQPLWVGGGNSLPATKRRRQMEWKSLPHRFEPGTPPIAGVLGLKAAIAYLQRVGMEQIENHQRVLGSYLSEILANLGGIDLHTSGFQGATMALFSVRGWHSHDLAAALAQKGIAVRAGYHCSRGESSLLPQGGSLRVSPYFYNTSEEVDYLATSLSGLLG